MPDSVCHIINLFRFFHRRDDQAGDTHELCFKLIKLFFNVQISV